MSVLKGFKILAVLFTIGLFLNCGGGGGGGNSENSSAFIKIYPYPINKYPIFQGKLYIQRLNDGSNQKILFSNNYDYKNDSSVINVNGTLLIEVKGGFQDRDDNITTCVDRLPNNESLFTFINKENAITVVSPITTELYNFSKKNPEVFFEFFNKLPKFLKDLHTLEIRLGSDNPDKVRRYFYYLSKFVGLENIKKEISDNGLLDGSVVSGLNENLINILGKFLSEKSFFKDKLLEFCIKKTLEKDITYNLTTDDLLNINSLECNGYGIESLEGIENLSNLIYLSLSSNNLKDISPVKNLQNLALIDISDNFINDYNQIKDLDTGIIFVENNCISNIENNDIISSLLNLTFGLDYQDKCKNKFHVRSLNFDPETKKLYVSISSKYFTLDYCRIETNTDDSNKPLVLSYQIPTDGKIHEYDTKDYPDKKFFSVVCQEYCPYEPPKENILKYQKSIYIGKNIHLEEEKNIEISHFINIFEPKDDSIYINIKEGLACYQRIPRNDKEIYLCNKHFRNKNGYPSSYSILKELSSNKTLEFPENSIYYHYLYNGYLYLILGKNAPNSIEKILKIDLNNLEIIDSFTPKNLSNSDYAGYFGGYFIFSNCYENDTYIFLCNKGTINIFAKSDFSLLKRNFLQFIYNAGISSPENTRIWNIFHVGNYLYISVELGSNNGSEEKLFIININDINNPVLVRILNLPAIISSIKHKNKVYASVSQSKIIILDVTNPTDPILLNTIQDTSTYLKMKIYNNLLFLSTFNSLSDELVVYSIHSDGNLTEELRLNPPDIMSIKDIYFKDDKLFIVNGAVTTVKVHEFNIKTLK